jgi:hypothetical protein
MPARAAAPVAPQADLGAPMICNHMLQSVWPPLLVMSAFGVGAASASTDLTQKISRAHLCVTEGTIAAEPASSSFTVDSPKMRAYVNAVPLQSIQAHFTYLGASSREVPLGSGTMRRQFGLKNPGQHSSAECGNRGYRNIKPQRSTPTPKLQPGDTHTLRAEMTATVMKVFIDGTLAWQGALSSEVEKWDSRVGIRSDNARVQLELTGPLNPANDRQDCKSEPAEAE